MNEKTTRQIEEMKKQTIGVEVEMNSIARSKAAKIAAGFFGTGRYQDTAGRNGYCTWSAWDVQGREWKFQRDVSISGADSEKCELVTPILTYSDMEILQELSGSSDTQGRRVMPQEDAESTSTLERTVTHHRLSGILRTSWQAMKALLQRHWTLTEEE